MKINFDPPLFENEIFKRVSQFKLKKWELKRLLIVILFNSFIAVLLLTSSCSREKPIGELKINQISIDDNCYWDSISISIKKGQKIWLWTDMDISYTNQVALRYFVLLSKNNHSDTLSFDPFNTALTYNEMKTSFGNQTNWSFNGRLGFIETNEDGVYNIKAMLYSNDLQQIKLKKGNLILKK